MKENTLLDPTEREILSHLVDDVVDDVEYEDVEFEVDTATKKRKVMSGKNHGGGRRKSDEWKQFTSSKTEMGFYFCNHCGDKLNVGKKVKVLKDHLSKKCKKLNEKRLRVEQQAPPISIVRSNTEASSGTMSSLTNSFEIGGRTDNFSASASKGLIQTDMRNHTCVGNYNQEKFELELAYAFITTNTPFITCQNSHFLSALHILRDDVQVPSRERMAGILLDKCYTEVLIDPHVY